MIYAILLQADTSDVGYRIGYQVGSWLPFILLAVVAFLIIRFRSPKR